MKFVPLPREPISVGDPHYIPWRAVDARATYECHYCERPFTRSCPPTFDHLVPRLVGGTRNDGTVLACQSCNSARGSAPYDAYMECVTQERFLAKLERREYRRPLFRLTGFTLDENKNAVPHGAVTTLPRRIARQCGL